MASLAVAEMLSPHHGTSMVTNKALRDAALWFPDTLGPRLSLNEESFAREDTSMVKFQPLCWVHFGGPGDTYLRSLTEVSAGVLGSVCKLQLCYTKDTIPVTCQNLGRRPTTDFMKFLRIPIDGPGGEVIEAIDVGLKPPSKKSPYFFFRQGKLNSFKAH